MGNDLTPKRHDFLTSLDGKVTFAVGYPPKATVPLRRVLDAAQPEAACIGSGVGGDRVGKIS